MRLVWKRMSSQSLVIAGGHWSCWLLTEVLPQLDYCCKLYQKNFPTLNFIVKNIIIFNDIIEVV